ncbi:MAG: hypothetical protein GYA46_05855 [candidate division Zixibacteria bacterium]|nr:hypothetical protein [candidate division Zixibacteria bacterium]
MSGFEDKRINEALELLNSVARDKKAELQSAIENKYADLSSVVSSFAGKMKSQAVEKYEVGKQKVVDVASDIDKSVHKNPWAYIGGAAFAGLVFGFLLGRSRRD